MEELPFGLLRSGTPWLQALVVMPMLLFSGLHFYLTKSDVQGVLSRLCALCQEKPAVTQRELDKHQRFEQELLKARLEIWGMVQRVIIHLCFWVNLAAMHNLMLNPNQAAFMQMVGPVLGYAMNTAIQTGVVEIKTASQFRILEAVLAGIYAVDLFEVAHVTEFEVFCSMEKMSAVTMLLISVMFIDLKMTVPVYVSGALVLTYKQWQLLGFSRVTPMLMCSTLCSHCVTVVVVMFIVYAMQRHIAARLDSDDTSSLLLAFRRVLRGVCDGELVLDRRNHRIVEDASSLERLLNAKKKLSETSFLDLFLDSEGRQRFLEFLDSESSTKENRATIPPCLRIALQGASGPVSTDVFFTSCGAAGQEYYLLAFRADPEQFIAPPDAVADGHKAPWQNDQMNHLSPPPASSVEVAEAFKELVQVALLVNTDTPAMDIEEVTLSFERLNQDGMPTLRSFIRINDWERVENLVNSAKTSANAENQQVHRFPSPLLFRIPGSKPRGYLLAKNASVSIADEEEGEARSFWVHLSALDVRHSRRRKEQDLESISENG